MMPAAKFLIASLKLSFALIASMTPLKSRSSGIQVTAMTIGSNSSSTFANLSPLTMRLSAYAFAPILVVSAWEADKIPVESNL